MKMEITIFLYGSSGIEMCLDSKLFDLEYTNDVVLPSEVRCRFFSIVSDVRDVFFTLEV